MLITQTLLFVVIGYCMFNSELVIYGLKQGKGQLSIILNTKKIEEVIKDSTLTTEEKLKIKLISDVRKFSVDSLAYKPSDSYSTFYDQRNAPSLWVITGSEPYSLTACTWKFPYLGKVSYKGYFDYMSGFKEYARLKTKGYDVELAPVSAWSTLGLFSDPILSNMLRKSKGRLANLIFHELFHNTYYAKSSVEENENLANFIAHKATLIYLHSDTAELKKYLYIRYDDSLYTSFILSRSKGLDSLYKAIATEVKEKKELAKKLALYRIYNGAIRLKLHYPNRYAGANEDILITKNAYFLDFKRYDELYDSLDHELKNRYNNDLRQMILDFKKRN